MPVAEFSGPTRGYGLPGWIPGLFANFSLPYEILSARRTRLAYCPEGGGSGFSRVTAWAAEAQAIMVIGEIEDASEVASAAYSHRAE